MTVLHFEVVVVEGIYIHHIVQVVYVKGILAMFHWQVLDIIGVLHVRRTQLF